MDELEPVLKRFVEAMAGLDIPFVIVGGFAVAGWGRARATTDIDVIIQIAPADIKRFVEALRAGGFAVTAEDVLDALRGKDHFSIFDRDTIYHLDAKGAYGEKEARTLKTRVKVALSGFEMPISGLEDTIANKLRFGREQDIEDALHLLVWNRRILKMDTLRSLCRDYGLLKDLAALGRKARRREAELGKPDRHR
jgi:hypothetical protein